jgi:sodium/proline symporter
MSNLDVPGRVWYVAVIIFYMVLMMFIGWIAARTTKNEDDYWVGGRRFGIGVLSGTFGATFISAVTMLGSPSWGYRIGWSFWNIAHGTWVGPLIMVVTAHYFVRFVSYTVPDILEARYGATARPLAAVVTLFGSFGYTGLQTMAMGTVLSGIMDWDLTWSIILSAGVVIAYTVWGGMLAVAWTDCVQFVWLLFGMFVTAIVGAQAVGGLSAMNAKIAAIGQGYISPTGPYGSFWILLGMAVAFGFGNPSQPSYLVRAFSAKNIASIRIALGVGTMANVLCIGAGVVIGMAARILLGEGIKPYDNVFPAMVVKLFHPILGGFIIAAIIAAIMSTADSFLLVSGVTISHDFYQRYVNPDASQQQLIRVSQWTTLIVGAAGLILALTYAQGVMSLGAYVFGTVAAGFFVPLYIGLFWRRANSVGGCSAIVIGFLGTFFFTYFKWIPKLHPIIIGVILSAIAYVIGTYLARPEPERVKAFMQRIGREKAA